MLTKYLNTRIHFRSRLPRDCRGLHAVGLHAGPRVLSSDPKELRTQTVFAAFSSIAALHSMGLVFPKNLAPRKRLPGPWWDAAAEVGPSPFRAPWMAVSRCTGAYTPVAAPRLGRRAESGCHDLRSSSCWMQRVRNAPCPCFESRESETIQHTLFGSAPPPEDAAATRHVIRHARRRRPQLSPSRSAYCGLSRRLHGDRTGRMRL